MYPADPFSPSLATGQTPKLPPLPSSAGPSSQSIAIAGPGQLPSSGGPPAGSAAELQAVFEGLPTTIVTRAETVELSVAFVAVGAAFAAVGLLLARAWRPLP